MKKKEMKLKPGALKAAQAALGWAAWGLAASLFVAGQAILFGGKTGQGALVSGLGVVVAVLRLVLPMVPWSSVWEGLKAGSQAAKAWRPAKPSFSQKGGKASPSKGPSALGAFWDKYFPEDTLELSRHWIWLPAGACLLLMQYLIIFKGSLVRGSVCFGAFLILAYVWFENMGSPLRLPKLRKNFMALAWLLPALPLQLVGAVNLWRYGQPWLIKIPYVSSVWAGFLMTVGASLWMIWSLKNRPFDLVEDEAATSKELAWSPPAEFFSPNQLALKAALLAAAGICAFLSLQVLGPSVAGLRVALGFASVFLLVASFPWAPRGLSSWSALPAPLRAGIALGLALLGFYLGMRGQHLMESGRKAASLWHFLFGAIVLVAALSRFKGLEKVAPQVPDLKDSGASSRWVKWVEILFVAVLAVASFQFRAWNLENFPYGAEGDEAGGGMWAAWSMRGEVEHPLIHQNYPMHFFAVTGVLFKWFGVSLSSLRWHAVLFGTLSIFSTYFFARLYFGRFSAFLATLLMAFSYWHLHYSRFGHYNIEQVFAQMTAFYFVFKGMKEGRLWHFVAGGMAFALAMFPHMAGRLLPFQGILFLVYLFVMRRDLLRRRLTGLLAFVIASWMVASPAVTYWLRATTVSMGRIQSVSIFDKNNTNAPIDVLAGFVQNTKVSFLMFNDYSDSRHRDNPLAPQKILEHWSAILFALAFLYVVYHWRDPLHFLLLEAFLLNLSASIFSVEAPQTLRTAGNIPLVFMFMAVLFAHLHVALHDFGRRTATALFALLLIPVGYFSYQSGKKLFVEARNLSFDVAPTYIASKAGQDGGPGDQAVFFATGFASSHPPVILFAEDTPIRNCFSMLEYMPVMEGSDRDNLIFLGDDYAEYAPYIRSLYPKAKQETIPNLMGGQAIAEYFRIPKEELQAIQGLQLEAREPSGALRSVPNAPLEFPQEALPNGATELRFSGSLRLPWSALCAFDASGTGDVSLRMGGREVYSRQGGRVTRVEALQPIGMSSFKAVFRPGSAADRISITLQAKPEHARGFFAIRSPQVQVLGKRWLFMAQPQGLYGRYYATRDWSGPIRIDAVEPGLLVHWLDSPMTGNWSVKWKARLKVETPGTYSFRLDGPNTEIKVQGRLVWRGGGPVKPEMAPPPITPTIQLAKGWHDLEAYFSTTGPPGMRLSWRLPEGREEMIPASSLEPVPFP